MPGCFRSFLGVWYFLAIAPTRHIFQSNLPICLPELEHLFDVRTVTSIRAELIFSRIVARLFLRLRRMFYDAYSPSMHGQTVYSTTIQWASPARRHESASLFTTIPWGESGYTLPSTLAQLPEYSEACTPEVPCRFFQDDEFGVLSTQTVAMCPNDSHDNDWCFFQSPTDVSIDPLSPPAPSSCQPRAMADAWRTMDFAANPTSTNNVTSADRPKTAPSAFTSSSTLVGQSDTLSHEERFKTPTFKKRPSTAQGVGECTKDVRSMSRDRRCAWMPLVVPKKAATRPSTSRPYNAPLSSHGTAGCTERRNGHHSREVDVDTPDVVSSAATPLPLLKRSSA